MLIPRVVGFKLSGSLPVGTTATDLVLTITEMLRNMSSRKVCRVLWAWCKRSTNGKPSDNRKYVPEYGSTVAIFPIDEETIKYLQLTGRSPEQLELVEKYAKRQGIWHDPKATPDIQSISSLI